MNRIYATTSPEISEREITNLSRSRKVAAEGMVLLKNNGILPMELEGRKIALFGNGARHTVSGGTGSGECKECMQRGTGTGACGSLHYDKSMAGQV